MSLPSEIGAILSAIPCLDGLGEDDLTVSRLGASSNLNFRVETPRGRFVLRLPRHDIGGFIDRAHEIAATRAAEEIGIGAEVVHSDAETGILLTNWAEGARAASSEAFRRDPTLIGRAGRLLADLHRSGLAFSRRFDVFAIMKAYDLARRRRGAADPWSEHLRSALPAVEAALERSSVPLVPSHCDPAPENLLDDGRRIKLIDWEYAGMNDPAWDLAYLALECSLDGAGETELLASYGDGAISAGRMPVFKLLVAALDALWHALRVKDAAGPDRADWARARLATAEALAADPRLPAWTADL